MITPTPREALELSCSMEAMKTLFSPARPIAATWTLGVLQLLSNEFCSFRSTFPLEMAGITDLYFVIVYV